MSSEPTVGKAVEPKVERRPRLSAVLIFVLAGATGSLGFMLYVGRHNTSNPLLALFTGCVLLPFAALGAAMPLSRRWSTRAQTGLNLLAAAIALAPLTIYGSIEFGPSRPRPAFAFLIVPLISLILVRVLCGMVALKRQNH